MVMPSMAVAIVAEELSSFFPLLFLKVKRKFCMGSSMSCFRDSSSDLRIDSFCSRDLFAAVKSLTHTACSSIFLSVRQRKFVLVEGVGGSLFFVLHVDKERRTGKTNGGTKEMSSGVWSRYCVEKINGGCRSSLVVVRAQRVAVKGDGRNARTGLCV